MNQPVRRWTNPSVITLAEDGDPVEVIQSRAKETVLEAAERGWVGPPYDPFHLADLMNISVLPNDEVFDARIIPVGPEGFRIEFNPHRPYGRIRYSVAHEIAHTLFPDCGESVRNRMQRGWFRDDEWQLELLCNIGAAEILMPTAEIGLENEEVDIDNLMKLRRRFDVSMEAMLIRIAKLTNRPCVIFAAARSDDVAQTPEYRIDYSVPSRSWSLASDLPNILDVTVLSECTAVGFTAKGKETWGYELPELDVECVGIPPYPRSRFPRVVGVLTSGQETPSEVLQVKHLFGDALDPRGDDPRIIAHIVNDATPNWGGRGFAQAVGQHWPFIQEDFRDWVEQDRRNLSLGNVRWAQISDDLGIVHMIAQHGYGQSSASRIRYGALDSSLEQLANIALERGASVHMPRIGTGQARGSWELIQELIDEQLARRGVSVSVYTLPDSVPVELQGKLNL